MKHLAKCTHCASLLKNISKYRNKHFYIQDEDMIIYVDTREEANLIEQMEGHQEATFKIYNELLK